MDGDLTNDLNYQEYSYIEAIIIKIIIEVFFIVITIIRICKINYKKSEENEGKILL